MSVSEEKRIESEREFHNKRFAEEVRQPTHGFYRTVQDAFELYELRIQTLIPGKSVLEYGCSFGFNSLRLASQTDAIVGIDLSDVAIEQATTAAKAEGINNTSFHVMNAEQLDFDDESFDLVFGSSILHHLDLKKSYSEVSRVLRTGGRALFLEPLGHNPAINAYRDRTPGFRTPDEHPLVKSDIELARDYFAQVDMRFFGLAGLFAIPLLKTPLAEPALWLGRGVDRLACRIPVVQWLSWFSVIEFTK